MLYISDFYILYVLAFFGAIAGFLTGNWPVGSILLIYSLFGVYYYLRFGTVRKATEALRSGKIEKAERLLKRTKYPDYLDDMWKGHYFLVSGIINFHKNNFAQAYSDLTKAVNSPFLTKDEQQLAENILENLRKTVQ